jgi:hypothetical protein
MAPMARAGAPLIPLGYGKYVRADRVFALVPLEGRARGDGRRTLVHVEGLDDPLVASRSESAIARDIAVALGRPNPDELVRERVPSDQDALF